MNKTHTFKFFTFIVLLLGFLPAFVISSPAEAVITKSAAEKEISQFQNKCNSKKKYNNNKKTCDSIVSTLQQNPPGCSTLNKEKILQYMNSCSSKVSKMSTAPAPTPGGGKTTPKAADKCGSGDQSVKLGFNVGCTGRGNPIADMTFAVIRFLTVGVGIVVTGSIIYGALQYIGSRGDPNNTARAVDRIRGSVIALLLFIFTYAILNFVIPGQFLR